MDLLRSMATQHLLRPQKPLPLDKLTQTPLPRYGLLTSWGSKLNSLVCSLETMAKCSQQSKALLATMEEQLSTTITQKIALKKIPRDDVFDCPYCEGFLALPVCLPCGHSMCRSCVEKLRNHCGAVCPQCQQPTSMNEASSATRQDAVGRKPTLILQNMLEKYYPLWVESCKYREEGNLFANEGDFPLAIQWYNKAVSTGAKDHRVLGNRSRSYLAMDRLEEALADAEIACKIRPFWKKGHFRRACVLERLGRWKEAIAAYLLCLHLSGNDHSVMIKMCQVIDEHMSEFTQAERTLSSHLYCNPGHTLDQGKSASDSHLPTIDTIVELCEGVMSEPADFDDSVSLVAMDVQDFECSLCTGVVYEPVTTTCGHSFCRSCLSRVFDYSQTCPVCRTVLYEYFQAYSQRSGVVNIDKTLHQIVQQCFTKQYQEKKSQAEAETLRNYRVGTSEAEPLPIFVCTLAYPGIPCPLHVFEPRYRLMIRRCMESGSRRFGMCQAAVTDDNEHSFSDYGTVLYITSVEYTPDGRSLVKAIGERRFKVIGRDMIDGYHRASVAFMFDERVTEQEQIESLRALQSQVYQHAKRWLDALPPPAKMLMMHSACSPLPPIEKIPEVCPNGPSWLWWYIHAVPISPQKKLEMYTCTSLQERLLKLQEALPVI